MPQTQLSPGRNSTRVLMILRLFRRYWLCTILLGACIWVVHQSKTTISRARHSSSGLRPLTVDKNATTSSQSNNNEATWFWSNYSKSRPGTKDETGTKRPNILIAQYSGFGKYVKMLDITQRANRAYARKWRYDYVAVRGLVLGGFKSYHANFNKCEVLDAALSHSNGVYDGVLLVDADAVFVDLDQDVSQLLNNKYAIVAAQGETGKNPDHWFNNGVVLWNFHHHRSPWLIRWWRKLSKISIKYDLQSISERLSGDQTLMHILILYLTVSDGLENLVYTPPMKEIFKMMRHVKRPLADRFKWQGAVDGRLQILTDLVNKTCTASEGTCDGIPYALS